MIDAGGAMVAKEDLASNADASAFRAVSKGENLEA